MNYKRLETFVWAATLLNFRQVAEQQCTTQPAISNRIAELEAELGVTLFDRASGPSPIRLTEKGRELLPFAERIVRLGDQIKKRANSDISSSGTLRLGVSETIVHTWLPDFLKTLSEILPALDIELTVDVTTNLRLALLNRNLDLAYLMGPLPDSEVVNLPLSRFPLVWVASSELQLPDRLLYLEELAQWPIITYARNTKPFAEISQRFNELDSVVPRFFSSSSLSACRQLTVDGVGISTLPEAMIHAELGEGSLVQIRTTWLPSELAFTAAYCGTPRSPLAERAAQLGAEVAQRYQITN